MHIPLPRNFDTEPKPRTWRWPAEDDWFAAHKGVIAYLTCVNGHESSIISHEVDEDDKLMPSVVCPIDGCDEHFYAKVVGWSEEVAPIVASGKKIIREAIAEWRAKNEPPKLELVETPE